MRSADAELFKDKIEVSLDGRQIFYLFFGGAVIATLVFVLGVMVGKRLEARSHLAGPAAGAGLDPLAALDQLGEEERAEEELLFPSALTQGRDDELASIGTPPARAEAAGKGAARPAQAPVAAVAAVAAAKPAGEEPGENPGAAGEKLAPAAGEKPAAPGAVEPSVPAKATPAAAMAKASPTPATRPEAAAAAPPATPTPAGAAAKARFTLQISSFPTKAEADAFMGKIAARGYKPYIILAEVPDKGRWYRVRVGRYGDYEEAVAAKTEFEKKENIIAYVSRL
jgi:cell division protein FtsN